MRARYEVVMSSDKYVEGLDKIRRVREKVHLNLASSCEDKAAVMTVRATYAPNPQPQRVRRLQEPRVFVSTWAEES